MNNYQIYDEIGKGRFSKVYKGRRKRTTEYYAISAIDKSQRQRVLTNVKLLRYAQHRLVIKFYDWYETNNHFWVITELCTGGDMRQVIDSDNRLSEAALRMFSTDIAEGLMHIHSCSLVYGNLKPSNILMDFTMTMRFYDFSSSFDFGSACAEGSVGTPLYMAPELFTRDGVPSMASDLWALGCVLYEMATGKPPFHGADLSSLITNILTEPFSPHEGLPGDLNLLLEALLVKDPLRRATWGDVVAHEFWRGKLRLPKTSFSPQPAFERRRQTAGGGNSGSWPMSTAEVSRHVEWAVENAKRNFMTQVANEGGSAAQCPAITDEVDLRDYGRTDNAAADVNANVFQVSAQGDNRRVSTGFPPASATTVCSELPQTKGQSTRSNDRVVDDNNSDKIVPTLNFNASPQILMLREKMKPLRVGELLTHASDAHVRPLVMNNRIERFVEQPYDANALGFGAPTKNELKALDTQERAKFITMVYQSLSSSSLSFEKKLHILCYFESICADESIANFVVNTSFMMLCLKTASQQKAPSTYRATAASIMGILVRHATFIHIDLARSNILSLLVSVCGEEESLRVKRKLIACLGELLIYIAVQREGDRAVWGMDASSIFTLYMNILVNADDVLKHYGVKAIESLASVGDRRVVIELFAKPEIVKALLAIYALLPSSARGEHMRMSAACAALKLATLREDLVPFVMESQHLKIRSCGSLLTTATTPKTAQALLTFINAALVKGLVAVENPIVTGWGKEVTHCFAGSRLTHEQGKVVLGTIQGVARQAVSELLGVMEHLSVAMKGKTLLLLVLLGCMDELLFLGICSDRNIGCIDNAVRDKDLYVHSCAACLACYFGVFFESQLASVANGARDCIPSIALNVVHNVMSARNIGVMVELNDGVFASLGACLEKAMLTPRYAAFEGEVNELVGLLTQNSERLLRHRRAVVHDLFPPYLQMLDGTNVERHFSALRVLNALVTLLVHDSGSSCDDKALEAKKLDHLMQTVAALLPSLLKEIEPVPILALRLLATCGEQKSTGFANIATVGLTEELVRYMMQPKPSDLSVPLQLLLLVALRTEQVTAVMEYLASQEFFTAVLFNTLTMAVAKGLDHLLEPCCELAAFVLKHAVGNLNTPMAQQCLFFLPQRGIETLWLPLCELRMRAVAEHAAACVYYLVRLSPQAHQGLLSTEGVNVVQGIISDTRENPVKVMYVLRALRYACERGRLREVQKTLQGLLVTLDAIAREGECNRELSLEASAIIALIRG